jgi:hypothetical protein
MNWMVRFVLTVETAACTSRVATSPRYSRQQATNTTNGHISVDEWSYKDEYALYFGSRESHLTYMGEFGLVCAQ